MATKDGSASRAPSQRTKARHLQAKIAYRTRTIETMTVERAELQARLDTLLARAGAAPDKGLQNAPREAQR